MADVKISALPAATTPLAGTELVPIVQSGVTSRVSVDNLTAGKTVAASTVNVDANTASAAVRITQTGAGNALLVEDSANPDATPFVIDQIGRVIVGNTTPFAASTLTPGINFQGPGGTGNANTVGINAFSADANGPVVYFGKSRSATIGSAGLVADGDFLGALFFEGSDGTAQRRGASIVANVDGTPGASDMPGRLVFSTTADGAGSPTERMRITNAGNVGIGTSAPGARFDVAGTARLTNAAYCQVEVNSGAVQGHFAANSGGTVDVRAVSNHPVTVFTNNTERMRVDANGAVLIGRSSSITYPAGVNPRLQIAGSSASETFVNVSRWVGNANGAVFDFLKSRGAAVGTNAIVQSGDTLGEVRFSGDDGANFLIGAAIAAQVDGTPGTNDMPTRLIFVTTPDGAGSPIERMRITNAGNVVAGGSVALATTATDGFLYVPTCAGVPTGTPTAITGMAPIVVNTTNNKLYFYSGGAWRDAGP